MSDFDARPEYFENPVVVKSHVGDFTPFYITIAFCAVFVAFLFVLNIIFCCSRYNSYWLDHNTGNRWLLPIWTKTPHKQPPLDYTELENNWIVQQHLEQSEEYQFQQQVEPPSPSPGYDEGQQFFELKKRERPVTMFHAYWPAVTALTMFVLGVIIGILKYGPRLCKTRHTTLPTHYDWEDGYAQEISNA